MESRNIIVGNVCKLNSATISSSTPPNIIQYLDTGSITKNKIESAQLLNSKTQPFPSRAQRKVKRIQSSIRRLGLFWNITES